jgi:microcystin-dependent protein
MPFWKWSRTTASNANADPSINWAEGQPPSSVNDSARAMMARLSEYRDDLSGAIATSGTSTAYAVSSYQVFDSLAHLGGQVIAFTPHTTNGAGPVTLNVDSLGGKPLRFNFSAELPAGALIEGTPYTALYNSTDQAFYLHGFFGNPYNIPVSASVDYWGSAAPNSSFALMYGQAISRTTYSVLFGIVGTTYGSGDGTTTFNIPDVRGRVVAGKDDMGGSAASRLSGASITTGGATTLGGSGGAETKTLATANLPPYTPAGTITNGAITILGSGTAALSGSFSDITPGSVQGAASGSLSASQATSTFAGTAQGGSSTAFALTQPTIIANKLLRII